MNIEDYKRYGDGRHAGQKAFDEPMREEVKGLGRAIPVRSLVHTQEVSFKLLDELYEVIESLESRLYHILAVSEKERLMSTDSNDTERVGSAAVGMATGINDRIQSASYRLQLLHSRIEL